MIVPMIKYGFLVYHRDFDSFLSRLQEMGLVDVERHTKVLSDEERNLINEINRYTQTLKDLKIRAAQIDQTGQVAPLNSDAVLNEYEDLIKEKEQVESSIRRAQKDLNDVRPWGNFNIDLLRKLSDSGLNIKFYVTNEKAFDESLLEDYTVEVINNEAGQVYFVWIQQYDQDASLPIEAVEVKIPNYSASGKETEIATHRGRISE
ncbi:MAG TPA: hypothetical protein DG754_12620, partial [Bacteroidales bacterium]|nr:hypothetical protein [Bacteroidales bacterium]